VALPRTPRSSEPVFGTMHFCQARNPIQDRMIQSGWCNSTAQMLHDILDNTGLYIASRLRPPSLGKSHTTCTSRQCFADQIDESTYVTKHIGECQGCQHISVDAAKVLATVERGEIPLVSIICVGDHDKPGVKLEVVTSQPYVAISHVWHKDSGMPLRIPSHAASCYESKILSMTCLIWKMSSSPILRSSTTYGPIRCAYPSNFT